MALGMMDSPIGALASLNGGRGGLANQAAFAAMNGNINGSAPAWLQQVLGGRAQNLAGINQGVQDFAAQAATAGPLAAPAAGGAGSFIGPVQASQLAGQAAGGGGAISPEALSVLNSTLSKGVGPLAPYARTGKFAGAGNFLAKTPFNKNAAGLAEQALAGGEAPGMFSAGGALGAGSIGRAGLYGLGGQLAGSALHAVWNDPNSGWDNAASDALKWGGAGAGIGSMIAPGIGTAIGGGLGVLAGGVAGLLGSRGEGDKAVASALKSNTDKISTLLDTYGASDELKKQALLQLQLGSMNATSKSQIDEASKAITAQLGPMIAQDLTTQESKRKRDATVAAAQAWITPMMQQQLTQSNFYAKNMSDAMGASAKYINDPALRANANAMAQQVPLNTAQSNAASLQQMAMTPALYGYSTPNGQTDLSSIMNAMPTAPAGFNYQLKPNANHN